ncbi:hypothetical protein Fcan01_26453 [Folsomia candida]|uniref:Uncharacterized protein n=1 Tax=Folsomia candida TaxID=158441 RepID=A0A226D3D4_FOLCA|nr:hypothetical protein Fcan01_26453 [Folsomia candida]
MIPRPDYDRGPDVKAAVKQMTHFPGVFYFLLDYIVPILVGFFSFSIWNPVYTMLRAVHNFEMYGTIVSIAIQISLGFISTVGFSMMVSTIGICILIISYRMSLRVDFVSHAGK